MDLIVRIGHEPVKEQLDNFVLDKKKKYSLMLELSDDEIRDVSTLKNNNTLDSIEIQSIDELSHIFKFINLHKIRILKIYNIKFTIYLYNKLGFEIQHSCLHHLLFFKVWCIENKIDIIPYIMRSNLKSMSWINCRVTSLELNSEKKYITDNYTLQEINYLNSNAEIPKGYNYLPIKEYYTRNKQIASCRFLNTMTLLLINRFGTLKFIPVDVFRIIAKKYYFDFIDNYKNQLKK